MEFFSAHNPKSTIKKKRHFQKHSTRSFSIHIYPELDFLEHIIYFPKCEIYTLDIPKTPKHVPHQAI